MSSTRGDSVTGMAPLCVSNGLVWVEVSVAGSARPLLFVLDSGCGETVLDVGAATELGLKLGRSVTVMGIAGPAPARRLRSFEAKLAGHRLTRRPLALDLAAVSRACDRRIDGLIGVDFLRAASPVQLDFAAGMLRLGDACEEAQELARVVMLKRRNDAWCVTGRVDGGDSRWLRVDTGYDGALAWHRGSSTLARTPARPSVAMNHESNPPVVVRLELDSLPPQPVEAAWLPRAFFPGESGLVGTEFLRRYRVTFQLDRRRMVLEPVDEAR